jgi:hypothetical protein
MSERGTIGEFAVKTVIVALAVIAAFAVTFFIIDHMAEVRIAQLRATIEASSKIGGRQFWTKLEQELERQADPALDLSPEKKRKILAQIKTLSDRWRPFILEAASAVSCDVKEPAKSPCAVP